MRKCAQKKCLKETELKGREVVALGEGVPSKELEQPQALCWSQLGLVPFKARR